MTVLLIILSIITLFSLVLILLIYKSKYYLTNKDKDFIIFTINMYIQYAEELDIHVPEQHKKIVDKLTIIKKKLGDLEKGDV